jgi:2-haloacid dehalogenase
MDLSDYSVLSFDCYGTMIDWETGILAKIKPWLMEQRPDIGDIEILETFGIAESEEEAAAPDTPYPTILSRVHRRMADVWGVNQNEDAAIKFGDSVGSWPPFADSHDALSRLGKAYRLVILSNVDRASFSESRARLNVDFDAVYTAEDIGSYKPDPRNFAYLLDQERSAGYEPQEILHIGQSLFHDHVPATAAGLATCWVQRPSAAGEHGAARAPSLRPSVDFHFTSLAELAEASGL